MYRMGIWKLRDLWTPAGFLLLVDGRRPVDGGGLWQTSASTPADVACSRAAGAPSGLVKPHINSVVGGGWKTRRQAVARGGGVEVDPVPRGHELSHRESGMLLAAIRCP
jgi:hypothetical protein